MKIISPSASFIQFGDLPSRPQLQQMSFALQEYDHFNVAFQFALRNDDGSFVSIAGNPVYYCGIASTACEFIQRVATCIPLCYKTTIDSFAGTIHLTRITYSDTTKNYNRDVTNAELVELLLNDFGLTVIQGTDEQYIHECCVTAFEIVYTVDSEETLLTITRYFDRFFVSVDYAMDEVVDINSCYRYCITDFANTILDECSNEFKRIAALGFNTKIKYSSTEDSFDFEYNESDIICNIITVPLYIAKTQFPKKRSVYRKSNGQNILLSAVLDKQPELMTDWMPEFFHECLNIALSHDFFYLNESSSWVKYVCDDEYKVDWANDYTDQGQGNTKVKRQIYNYKNDNCSLPNDCCLPPYYTFTNDEESIFFTVYTSIRTGLLQLRYREGGTEDWSYAPDITNISIPVTAYIFDYIDLGYSWVEFEWRQKCGDGYSNWTPVQSIGGAGCVEISNDAFAMEDAHIGIPYHVEIPFAGSDPITLTVVSKPAWATVTVTEGGPNLLIIDGTPDTESAGDDFSILLTNDCTTDYPFDFTVVVKNDVFFTAPSDIVEDADDKTEHVNLFGPPAAVINIKIHPFVNSNGGTLQIDGSPSVDNNTFNVTLDGSGNGYFLFEYFGNSANHSTAMAVTFTIQTNSLGTVGSPSTFLTSKAYL